MLTDIKSGSNKIRQFQCNYNHELRRDRETLLIQGKGIDFAGVCFNQFNQSISLFY